MTTPDELRMAAARHGREGTNESLARLLDAVLKLPLEWWPDEVSFGQDEITLHDFPTLIKLLDPATSVTVTTDVPDEIGVA